MYMNKNLKIRLNIFETNSSSTHSVSFNRWIPGRSGQLVPGADGKIHVTGGEFGWEWGAYNDPETKINYYFVFYNNNDEMTKLGVEIIKNWTGRDVVLKLSRSSYIDHQSTDTLDFDVNNPGRIRDFFFNPDTWLYTGNDNEDTPEDFKALEKEELQKFGEQWTIRIEYQSGGSGKPVTRTFKLSEYPSEDVIFHELDDGEYIKVLTCNLEEGKLSLEVIDDDYWEETVEAKIVSIESDKYGKIL